MPGSSVAAEAVHGGGDGTYAYKARLRHAWRSAARDSWRAGGQEAVRERASTPPRRQGGSSRGRLVASPTLVAAAKLPDLSRTSSPPRKCEHQRENHLDKA